MTWHPLSTCPENTQVLFGWDSNKFWPGRTAINRATGERYFYGPFAIQLQVDDNPPTHYCLIPAWEKEGE